MNIIATAASEGYSSLPHTGGDPIGLAVTGVALLALGVLAFRSSRRAA
jgi:LPXTG-motif cell wall-anchored protein